MIIKDNVNHPSHYTQGNIECIEAIKEATKHLQGIEAICVGNVIKYVWRYRHKNGLEDLKKAQWYLSELVNDFEGQEQEVNNEQLPYSCDSCKHYIKDLDDEPCRSCAKSANFRNWEQKDA